MRQKVYSTKAYIMQLCATALVLTVMLVFSLMQQSQNASATPNNAPVDIDGLYISFELLADSVPQHDHDHEEDFSTQGATATAQTPSPPTTQRTSESQEPATPYRLTNIGVNNDLGQLGYTLQGLNAVGIDVIAHKGPIPKRCASNGSTSYVATSQGLAVRDVTYRLCDDGQEPLYDAYHNNRYNCTVIYNQDSSKKIAILAHEVGHCFYHGYGDYGDFDVEYKLMRDAYHLDQTGIRELIADDFMICVHNQDTAWSGNANYYNRYSMPRPDAAMCSVFNELVATYLQ